ncbi:hypothetical protein CHS0354_016455, partial [Potamilus streckersoni]
MITVIYIKTTIEWNGTPQRWNTKKADNYLFGAIIQQTNLENIHPDIEVFYNNLINTINREAIDSIPKARDFKLQRSHT